MSSSRKVLLMVRHRTQLEYDRRVRQAHSEVRKTPVDTGLQTVVSSSLTVSPAAQIGTHRDYFSNVVSHFNLTEPHDSLTLSAESVVETTDAICCGLEAPPDPRHWSDRLAEFITWSPGVPELPHYETISHGVRPYLAPGDFLLALEELGDTFQRRFRYDPEATHVHSDPSELFEQGGGVCQDLSHAMLGVLRLAGVPCRYASGYIYDPHLDGDPDRLLGTAASHAWVQAWHPEFGWVGIDPTNNRMVDWQYVRVAVGRDYLDVQPLRGVFFGEAGQHLDVSVQLTRLS
jgi:transglutaminase-like putative cysteine protease